MNNIIRKKIVLSLLDSEPKSANEIADEIDESLTTVEAQLTELVSESICEEVNQDEVDKYVVRKDIETFSQLVKEFLSDKEEHKEQIEQFITSEYYFARIDDELLDYVRKRFYLDAVHQADDEKEANLSILRVSPSALSFALYGDTASFSESWNHLNQLNSSEENHEKVVGLLLSSFGKQLAEMLIADLKNGVSNCLYDKFQIRLAKIKVQVGLATVHERYVEVISEQNLVFSKLTDDLIGKARVGQLVTRVNPIDLSDDGLTLLNLEDFEGALKFFNDALDVVKDPIEKAIVLNNKGFAFLRFKQYQKAIACFEEGIASDSEGEIPQLRENKQITEEYLAIATDADNLTEPTQTRFVQGQPVPFEETRFYEFKEIKGGKPANSITNTADEYAVAFLNKEGGRVFWGVRNSDRITVGVNLDNQQRDEVRCKVSQKLWAIRPSISDQDWQLDFHQVYDSQGETITDLWVVELVIPPQQEKEVFYTNSGELFVKTPGGKQKLLGPQVTEFIRDRLQDDAETE